MEQDNFFTFAAIAPGKYDYLIKHPTEEAEPAKKLSKTEEWNQSCEVQSCETIHSFTQILFRGSLAESWHWTGNLQNKVSARELP